MNVAKSRWVFAAWVFIFADAASAAALERKPKQSAQDFAVAVKAWGVLDANVSANLTRFIHAYPDEIAGVEAEPKKEVKIRLRGGAVVPFASPSPKDYEARLAHADVNEMLFDAYPPALEMNRWPENLDPGRYRCTEFFKGVYGRSEKEVAANVTKVSFCGKKVSFNRRNGAAAALAAVGKELESLVEKDAALKSYVNTLGGTFAWRAVDGTEQLSAHSWAIAIDLNPDLGGYWRWEKRGLEDMKRRKAYPAAIIAAFERHGFIWGGKWHHFDLMHFEYRPEFQGHNPFAQGAFDSVAKDEEKEKEKSEAPQVPHAIPVAAREEDTSATSPSPAEPAKNGEAVLALGLDVYRRLAAASLAKTGGTENISIAPASLYRSLEVMRWLAEGEASAELVRVLRVPEGSSTRPVGWPQLAPAYHLRQAVSLWAPPSLPLSQELNEDLVSKFDAQIRTLAFDPAGTAVRVVNDWAVTRLGSTGTIASESDFARGTQLVLVSGFHCRTAWSESFAVKETVPGMFHDLNGAEASMPMLHGAVQGGWLRRPDGLQALSIPLRQSALQLVLLLPPAGREGLAALEASLTADYVRSLISSLKPIVLEVGLPSVTVQQTTRLEPVLQSLGLSRVFESMRIPRLKQEQPTKLSHVLHNAFLVLGANGGPPPTKESALTPAAEITLDRPFVYLIVDAHSWLTLAVGRVATGKG